MARRAKRDEAPHGEVETKTSDRLRLILTSLARLAAAALLAYIFIVVLISASFQSSVARRLADLNPRVEYSTAYARWAEDRAAGEAMNILGAMLAQQTEQLESAKSVNRIQRQSFWLRQAPLRALHRRLLTGSACQLPERLFESDDAVAEALSMIRQCLAEPGFPAVLRQSTESFLADSGQLVRASQSWNSAADEVERVQARVNRTRASIVALRQARSDALAVKESFSEMESLRSGWLGGGLLISFPPSLTHILLSFVSGLFGALLITLVLIVYPKSQLSLTHATGSYGARVLLGGLISLCVFVVIGGGTAVLGTANAFAGAEINFMAICAIGILAGMFSDRVAYWLSDRADTFFSRERERVSDTREATPAPAEPGP